MSLPAIGDKVRIIRHKDTPNEIHDKQHFAIGSVHVVRDIAREGYGVYLPDEDGDDYLILFSEIEKTQ